MALDPQTEKLLQYFNEQGTSLENTSVEAARANYETMTKRLNTPEEVHDITDRKIPGFKQDIWVRIYRPQSDKPLPLLVYYHGGGWVIGNLNTHDALCRTLANHAECTVISVDYSLAPEEKFPVAVEDAYQALEWAARHHEELNIDPERIAVAGDSAGGNLATVVCYLTRERQGPKIVYQVLIYPSTGYVKTASYEKFSEGYHLTKESMNWFRSHYLNGDADLQNPLAAPLLIEDVAGLPEAHIITAEYDPLKDGGKMYADKLTAGGVKVTYKDYPGMIHGFFCMTGVLDKGKQAVLETANALRSKFSERG